MEFYGFGVNFGRILECIWVQKSPPGTLGTPRWSSEAPDQKKNQFWMDFGTSSGSILGPFEIVVLISLIEEWHQYASPFLESSSGEVPRPVRDPKIGEKSSFWGGLDVLSTDFIYYFYLLPDALPRLAPDLNFGGFGWISDPCWDPLDLHLGVF